MPIEIRGNEDDYILYEILCDYLDEEYIIKYMLKDEKPSIEACPFCSNPMEEPTERTSFNRWFFIFQHILYYVLFIEVIAQYLIKYIVIFIPSYFYRHQFPYYNLNRIF
jgi:hypothetical protein